MPGDRKLQVFVSSTYTDLKLQRQAAVEAILTAGHIPAGMELFAAGDKSQMEVIRRWIDESDVFLLIMGGRYGSIDKDSVWKAVRREPLWRPVESRQGGCPAKYSRVSTLNLEVR